MLLLLDRDGVINRDSPGHYVCRPHDWQPIAGSLEAIASLCSRGYEPVVVSNQSGLARGLFSREDLEAIHLKMTQHVESAGGRLHGIYYCPHLPGAGCNCRKPRRGLLDAIEQDMGRDVWGAPMIGDKLSDLQLAVDNGCQPILVRSGHGRLTEHALIEGRTGVELPGLRIFDTLEQASAGLPPC